MNILEETSAAPVLSPCKCKRSREISTAARGQSESGFRKNIHFMHKRQPLFALRICRYPLFCWFYFMHPGRRLLGFIHFQHKAGNTYYNGIKAEKRRSDGWEILRYQ
ncbi:MAG: hypothetical protein MR581_09370 [Lachnospiraceae bacterium]|nr:hypothetical protein [Lachnospiraceae bacterium]MDD7048664.1 hypothetical protein [Lachnospiraceae bacterium]